MSPLKGVAMPRGILSVVVLTAALGAAAVTAQEGEVALNEWGMPLPTYDNPTERAEGPYERLVIRGVTIIDGTGAPPRGPYDIVIEGDTIVEIRSVGLQGLPNPQAARPEPGEREIDAAGMTMTPGFVNTHGHLGPYSVPNYEMSYIYKLWLAHGITTTRIVGSLRGLDWTVAQGDGVRTGEIEGPDIQAYAIVGLDLPPVTTAEEMRAWVRDVHSRGAVGLKLHSGRPDLIRVAIEEADFLGMQTTMHHAQVFTPSATVLDTARWGLGSMEHFWYGLPEALFTDRRIQDYPEHHNYDDELHRFQGAARIWAQAAPPGSDRWNEVMDELVEIDFTISPTFAVKSATLDVMASRRAEWNDEYAMPWQWDFFRPGRQVHGSFWFDWTSADEAAAYEDYNLGMTFVNEFKNRGGRVVTGEDAGYALCLYGFCYVKELEFLQKAGFSPLEVLRAATLHGAELLGIDDERGTITRGKKADLVIVDGNPMHDLKIYRGTKVPRLDDQTGHVERFGGVKWTIKDGRVYDAEALLEDVRNVVQQTKTELGIPPGPMQWDGPPSQGETEH